MYVCMYMYNRGGVGDNRSYILYENCKNITTVIPLKELELIRSN